MKSILNWFVLIVSIALLISSCAKDDSSSASTDNTTSSSDDSSDNSTSTSDNSTSTSDNSTSTSDNSSSSPASCDDPYTGSGIFLAGGVNGQIIRSTNNGASWDNVTSDNSSYSIMGFAFGNNTLLAGGFHGHDSSKGLLMLSTDNFSTWDNVSTVYNISNPIFACGSFYVGGGTGLFPNDSNHFLRSTDNGSTFNSLLNTGGINADIVYGNNTFVVAGLMGKNHISQDGGSTWDNLTMATSSTVGALAFGDNTFVSATITSFNPLFYTTISRSVDNGSSWDNVTFGWNTSYSFALQDITFGNGVFVAVGDNGTIIRSTDAGASWDNVTSISRDTMNAVGFGNNTFIAVGNQGRIIRSTDNGTSWDNVTSPVATHLNRINF